MVVLCGGLGWLLQLTQGHSLCIPASPRLALAHPGPVAARWQGLQTTSHPHDLNVLPAGSLDPCREGAITWQMGEAQEACLRFSVAAGLLPALHGITANCPPLHICIPDTLGSYVSRIVRKRPQKSKSVSTCRPGGNMCHPFWHFLGALPRLHPTQNLPALLRPPSLATFQ